ncbi:MAG: hypothetical protein QXU97_02660 [Fervidicoccaceae archaeon]
MPDRDSLGDLWRCNCQFCRLFALRLLRRVVKLEYASDERGDEAVSQSEVDLAKDLRELKTTVEELKRAMVELKAALADLTGPFSAYKPLEDAERYSAGMQAAAPAQPQLERVSMRSEKPSEAATIEPGHPVEKPGALEERGLTHVLAGISEVLHKERARITRTGLERVLKTIKTLYELRRLYPRANIETIVKMLEEMKVLTSEEANLLKTAMNLVEESLRENISHEENVLMMFMLLRQLGVKSEELEEEALRTMLDLLTFKRRKRSSDIATNVNSG